MLTLKVVNDENETSPREWDNAGTIVCWHNKYDLGDKHDFSTPRDFLAWWKESGKGGKLLPLYLYDNSGISIRTVKFSCPWDSGQVGYVYITAEKIKKAFGDTVEYRKKAIACMKAEVETYDQYLRCEVYSYRIEDENGGHVDSCYGFIGRENAVSAGQSAMRSAQAGIDAAAQMEKSCFAL